LAASDYLVETGLRTRY